MLTRIDAAGIGSVDKADTWLSRVLRYIERVGQNKKYAQVRASYESSPAVCIVWTDELLLPIHRHHLSAEPQHLGLQYRELGLQYT